MTAIAGQEMAGSSLQLQRLGVVMEPQPGNLMEAEGVLNPASARSRDGQLYLFPRLVAQVMTSMALIHRPLFPGTGPDEKLHCRFPQMVDILRESIWISYHSLVNEVCDKHHHLCHFDSHQRLAMPIAAWEQLKIGGGTPPILTPQGWLFLYHGVCESPSEPDSARRLSYSAGLLVLDEKHPHLIRYRSPEPVLSPETPKEREGIVPNVVFPTAIDRRDDLGLPGRFDVYYGMADYCIGAARLDLPEKCFVERPLNPSFSINTIPS